MNPSDFYIEACPGCRQLNRVPRFRGRDSLVRCGRCGRKFGNPFTTAAPRKLATSDPRVGWAVQGFAAVCFIALCVVAFGEWTRLTRVKHNLDEQIRREDQSHAGILEERRVVFEKRLGDSETIHRARMGDSNYLSGATASHRRDVELLRRTAHDPAYARSVMETNLLQMERLGKDPRVSARDALAEVARLASPPGSRIEVTLQDNLFLVKVAFRMSSLSAQEAGAVTKHHTPAEMRREVETLSAQVIRELFDYCGTRGIARLQVSCNHAVHQSLEPPDGSTEEESRYLRARTKVVMDRLYRVGFDPAAASLIADWRRASVSQIVARMKVDYDGFDRLTITPSHFPTPQGRDPDLTLKF